MIQISDIGNIWGIIAITVLIWIIPLIFILNLVMFLFKIKRNIQHDRMQVNRELCPELFSLIQGLVKKVGCKMPHKIYISPEVNAYVFYNTSFWNIFFPVKKNLNIGLGLLSATNIDELTSILAHEFGHFTQKSMKVGSVITVFNQIITDLAYSNGVWDKLVAFAMRVRGANIYLYIIIYIVFGITLGIKKTLQLLSKHTNKVYYELSRQMEFEADKISANLVGSNVFISGLTKVSYNNHSMMYTWHFIEFLAFNYHSRVKDLFLLHDNFTSLYLKHNNIQIDCHHLVLTQNRIDEIQSKVYIKDIWNDHPTMEDRIKNLPPNEKTVINYDPSFSLFPQEIRNQLTSIIYALTFKNKSELSEIDSENLERLINVYIDSNIVVYEFEDFLNHSMEQFELEMKSNCNIENPFTTINRKILKEYKVALADLHTLENISNGDVETDEIIYNGIIYKIEDLPISTQHDYIQSLSKKVYEIDNNVFQFVYSSINNDEFARNKFIELYKLLWAINNFILGQNKIKETLSINSQWDNPSDVHIIKWDIRAALKEGCNCLGTLLDETLLKMYIQVIENINAYTIPQLLHIISDLYDKAEQAMNMVQVDLSKFYERANK